MDIISEYKAGRRDFVQANCYQAKLVGAVLADADFVQAV